PDRRARRSPPHLVYILAMSPTGRMVAVNGTQLYVEDTDPDGSTKPTIAFSHGLLWSTELFALQISALRDRYRCIAWDHRGQGRSASDHRACIGIELVWQDAAALLDLLAPGPVH